MAATPQQPEILIANGKYKLGRRLGSGSFGEVFEGKCIETGMLVGVKLESIRSLGGSQLVYEYNIYKILKGKPGVPGVLYFGKEGQFNVMVMELLGHNLEDLLSFCGGKLGIKTVCMIAIQLITRLEDVHSKGLLHRDIKPENFLIGLGKNAHILYVIDFGLAKKYIDSKTKQHMEYSSHKDLTGTVRYASLNAHLGIAQSRRDDLESLGFLFVYFLKGCLPWQGLKADTKKKKYEKVLKLKIETSIDSLTKGTPEELKKYLTYCRELRFEQKPDYSYLRRLFTELFTKSKFTNDNTFDWTMIDKSGSADGKSGSAAGAATNATATAAAGTATAVVGVSGIVIPPSNTATASMYPQPVGGSIGVHPNSTSAAAASAAAPAKSSADGAAYAQQQPPQQQQQLQPHAHHAYAHAHVLHANPNANSTAKPNAAPPASPSTAAVYGGSTSGSATPSFSSIRAQAPSTPASTTLSFSGSAAAGMTAAGGGGAIHYSHSAHSVPSSPGTSAGIVASATPNSSKPPSVTGGMSTAAAFDPNKGLSDALAAVKFGASHGSIPPSHPPPNPKQ